jgi:MFS family permease
MLEKVVSTVRPDPAAGSRLWRNRSFTIFWTGQTLSVLGDAFALIALPLLVLQATGSVGQMGLVTAVIGVCRTATGLFAGWLADHHDRRRLMICCDVGRTFLYAALPILWWLMGPHLWLLYMLAALSSCLGMIFLVTFGTAVANLVDPDQIALANGHLQASFSLSEILGPILAGIVAGLVGPSVALTVDACSFLISTLSLLLIRLRPMSQSGLVHQPRAEPSRTEVAPEKPQARQQFWRSILAGAHFIWQEPVLRSLAILLFFLNMMNAGNLDIIIFHLKHDLGQSDSMVGIVLGGACVGGVVAGLIGPSVRKYLGFGPCWIGGFGLYFAAVFLIGFSTNLLLLNMLVGLLTFSMTVTAICSISLRQQITPDALLGRVTSTFLMIVTALAPLGAVLFTALTARFGVTLALGGMGIGGICIVCVALLTPIRQRFPERRAPAVEAIVAKGGGEPFLQTPSDEG